MTVSKRKIIGQVAQSVEQRTENPCVGGSTPSLATTSLNIHLKNNEEKNYSTSWQTERW